MAKKSAVQNRGRSSTGPPREPEKPLPSGEQLRAYADQLPEMYHAILTAFQEADPNRFEYDGLLAGTLRAKLATDTDYNEAEIGVAMGRLIEAGFFRYEDYPGVYRPTRLGEELLAVVTGRRARRFQVPELPKPSW
jgi:hypothetical protein